MLARRSPSATSDSTWRMARLSVRACARWAGREISIARAEREAVGVANDGADDDFSDEPQIGDHAAQHRDLSRVLLAEEGEIGLGGDQQLGDRR